MVMADPAYGETTLPWDVLDTSWLAMVRRILGPAGSLWCWGSLKSFLRYGAAFATAGFHPSQDIVWEKHNGSNHAGDRFKRVHEIAAQFYRDDTRWESVWRSVQVTLDAVKRSVPRRHNPQHTGKIAPRPFTSVAGGPRLMRSVFHERSCHGCAVHPTQKPEAVIRPLVAYSCPPGGLVLDPFMGSGTTLRVARALGRRAIGIEIDEQHCASAVRLLRDGSLR